MKKRIVYITGVGWNWIKQRPQFIAEELTKDYEVLVVDNHGGKGANKTNADVKFIKPWRMVLERYYLIKKLNILLFKLYLRFVIKKYDILWIASPTVYAEAALSVKPSDTKLVYDCMDDHLEFSNDYSKNIRIRRIESAIYSISDVVLCSAGYLADKLRKRYGSKDITIINNALSEVPQMNLANDELPEKLLGFKTNAKKLTYVGTIAEWMDVELIKKITQEVHGLEIFFFGPCGDKMQKALNLPHVHLMGPIPHSVVASVLNMSDALIMPFKLTELILSVNPVKLYEYIASGKPSIAPLYGESIQFSDYAYLYTNEKDCVQILNKLVDNALPPKKEKDACIRYAEKNTWKSRYDTIKETLDKI